MTTAIRGIRQPIPAGTVLANIGSVTAQPQAIPIRLLASQSKGTLGSGTVSTVATGTGLTGGPITTTGTISLADTAVTPAAYGDASHVATFTVDQQGRLALAASTAIAIDAGAITSGTLGYSRGGTGATSFTNHGVVVAGASALATVAPGASGNVLTSNGTDWTSSGGAVVNTAAQTFLGGDVALNNSANYFDVVNTGSIGASGQVLKITACACVLDTAAAATFKVRIWDATTVYVETEVTTSAASFSIPVTVSAIITPAAAGTYYLSVRDASANTGVVKTTGTVAGTSNKASWIIAERVS